MDFIFKTKKHLLIKDQKEVLLKKKNYNFMAQSILIKKQLYNKARKKIMYIYILKLLIKEKMI